MPLTLDPVIKNYQIFIEKHPHEIFDQTKMDLNALTGLIDDLSTKSIMIGSTKPDESKTNAFPKASTDWAHQLKIREKWKKFQSSNFLKVDIFFKNIIIDVLMIKQEILCRYSGQQLLKKPQRLPILAITLKN